MTMSEIQNVVNELVQLRASFLEIQSQNDITLDDIQRLISCTEDFHRHISILHESGLISSDCVSILGEVLISLQQCEIFCNKKPVGRPKLFLCRDQLEFLLSMGFNKTHLSRMLGVSTRTITRRMTEYNLVGVQYSELIDQDLDRIVIDVHRQFPNAGYRQVLAILKSQGVLVIERRLRESLQRCDPLGSALRWFATIQRRSYNVSSPLALWHLDGNHKLIRWRLVVHGAIDGYSRLVVFLRCSNNNRAVTVFQLFEEAVAKFGLPSRIRTDKGGENVDAAVYMLEHPRRGTGRGSVITGSSTHNQRIERLWRDVYTGVLSLYHSLFNHLEERGVLDPLSNIDLFSLHTIFLPRINRHIDVWSEGWNQHRMRTAGSLSPLQQFTEGLLRIRGSDSIIASETFENLNQEDERQYGIDWDGPVPNSNDNDDYSHVEVPNTEIEMTETQKMHLNSLVQPLADSDCYGIDLYMQVRNFLLNLN